MISPVSFLFADDHRLSFIGGEQALANIVESMFAAAEGFPSQDQFPIYPFP
jgi:hypothetical protein